MKRYLQFENVGRSHFSGRKLLHTEITTPDEIANVAYDIVRNYLMSQDIECTYDSETNTGLVHTGFHTAGRFFIVSEAISKI